MVKNMTKKLNGIVVVALCVSLGVALGGTQSVVAKELGVNEADTKAPDHRPNILVIVADDLGFSDLGAFGGEIPTPNLDALATAGIRFTGFHTAPTCSPTRAMLMTGEDHHDVGLGTMAEMPMPNPRPPNYEGYLHGAETIADRLKAAGYFTAMAGKWHLGTQPGQFPSDHGFDRSYALNQGASNHFGADQDGAWATSGLKPTYSADGKLVKFPTGTYAGDFFTTRLIEFLKPTQRSTQPFFAYLAFSDPHWPLQAPADLIAKYRGKYAAGYEALRAQRLARMKALGLVPEDVQPAATIGPKWDSLTPEQQALSSRAMEVYAAMVDRLDQNVGRVIAALRTRGQLDNTVIIFLSDNGAEGTTWAQLRQLAAITHTSPALLDSLETNNAKLDKVGSQDSYILYGPGWAQAATAPSWLFKGLPTEGGIRTPAFITGADVKGDRIVTATLSVRDILPTALAFANVKAASAEAGGGRSWAGLLTGATQTVRTADDFLFTEFSFRRAIRRGDWKALYLDPNSGMLAGPGQARWMLFNLKDDPAEQNDLSASHPEELKALVTLWGEYAHQHHVIENQPIRTPAP